MPETVNIGHFTCQLALTPGGMYRAQCLIPVPGHKPIRVRAQMSTKAMEVALAQAVRLHSKHNISAATGAWGFFKKLARIAKKIIRSKIIRKIAGAIKKVVHNPIVAKLAGLARFVPGIGTAIHAGYQTARRVTGMVDRLARGSGSARRTIANIRRVASGRNPNRRRRGQARRIITQVRRTYQRRFGLGRHGRRFLPSITRRLRGFRRFRGAPRFRAMMQRFRGRPGPSRPGRRRAPTRPGRRRGPVRRAVRRYAQPWRRGRQQQVMRQAPGRGYRGYSRGARISGEEMLAECRGYGASGGLGPATIVGAEGGLSALWGRLYHQGVSPDSPAREAYIRGQNVLAEAPPFGGAAAGQEDMEMEELLAAAGHHVGEGGFEQLLPLATLPLAFAAVSPRARAGQDLESLQVVGHEPAQVVGQRGAAALLPLATVPAILSLGRPYGASGHEYDDEEVVTAGYGPEYGGGAGQAYGPTFGPEYGVTAGYDIVGGDYEIVGEDDWEDDEAVGADDPSDWDMNNEELWD